MLYKKQKDLIMKLYKYKIFDLKLMQYIEVSGFNTWFTLPEVAEAYTKLRTNENNSRYEVHEIYLTTICRLEN